METSRSDINSNIHYQQRPKDTLEVEELTRGLKVRSDKPHLVSLGGGRLSTAVTLLPLDEGITRIGTAEGQDIKIHGAEAQKEHCYIENDQTIITLCPLNKALVTIDGEKILHSVVLTQGCMLCLGRANYFRFNHPEQAMKLRGSNTTAEENDRNAGQHAPTSLSSQQQADGDYCNKGQLSEDSHAGSTELALNDQQSPSRYRDDLVEQSFKNKLRRFETLTSQEDTVMSPPPTTPNLSKFSYLNYVGEKLFTKDTNTTRLSMDESQINSDSATKGSTRPSPSLTNGQAEHQLKPPKPEVKPKPAFGKLKPKLDSKTGPPSTGPMAGRSEFKTLSMISTETSIWGSTSSAGTVRLDDELASPVSCNTPIDDQLDHPDVFSDEMTSSLSMKHQQMIEERKLEEAMEKKEQERLEEILAMCAQYEEQIDSEIQINSAVQSTSSKSKMADNLNVKGTPPSSLGLTNICKSNYDGPPPVSSPTSQLPDVLSDSFHSVMSSSSSSYSDHRRNIKTNGSLIHSPTSPTSPRVNGTSAFNYNNNSSKPLTSTSNPTYTKLAAYQDDDRLYDCPADYDLRPSVKPAPAPHGLLLNSSMTASIYADDNRIYDSPADIMVIPPPVPSHSRSEASNDKPSNEAAADKRPHHSMDSSSSELTVVSSAGSYRSAAPELSASFTESNKLEDISAHLDNLKLIRSTIIENLSKIKTKIMEVETQQSESVRELEMEQALLQGEQQSELNKLQAQWEEGDMLKSKRHMVMSNFSKHQNERSLKIEEARERLHNMEERRVAIEEQLRVAPDEEKDDLLIEYENELEALENQKKVFEDLEFQQLEMEAKFEEESEAVQRELNDKQCDLVSKIKRAEDNLAHMTKQQTDMMEQTRHELEDMEKQRNVLVCEFQKEKQKMLTLDHKIKDVQKNHGNGLSNSQYSEHDEMLLASPSATLNRNLWARMKPGDILMEEERRRLESLKHAATEASILQWHEQRSMENNLRRFGTLDSEEENMSTRSSETPSDGDKISYNSSMDDQERFTELQLLLAQARHHVQNAENSDLAMERKLRVQLEQQLAAEKSKREELEQQVQLREKINPNQSMRPLTRYLPVREEKFDLRNHVESTGHNLGMCPFVEVSPTQCKGYLLKMGTKVKTWNKRWFVFDREKKALLYYIDKSESKPRGGIYFQSIEDVFVDHMRNVKSPNQKLTFCVKTYDKPFYLVAKSPEALSIWIDVIFTGAEGYQEF